DLQTSQPFEHSRDFPLRNAILVMKRGSRCLRPRPEPVRRRPELIRSDLRMTPAHFAPATTASPAVNAIGFDFGLRHRRNFGVGDDLLVIPNQITSAFGASGFLDRHVFNRATVVFG